MLAAGRSEPIDHQHQSAIAQACGLADGGRREFIERRFKAELAPQMARHQHRSPIPCRERANILAPNGAIRHRAIRNGVALQQASQFVEIEMGRQQVPPPEIEHGAMARLAVVPIGFDHAHIFVLDALGAGGADDAQEHRPLPKHVPAAVRMRIK